MAMDPEFPDRPHTTSETSWSSLYKKSLPGRCPARVRNFTAIFIDDIDDAIPANLRDRDRVCKYADDCIFYESISTIDQSSMQVVLNSIHEWTTSNHMLINSKKTKDMLLTFRKSLTTSDSLYLNGNCGRVNVFKLLGAWFQDDLRWNHHIEEMTKKANRRLFLLRECRKANLPKDVGITLYNTKIRPLLQYASPVWGGLPNYLSEEVQRVQDRSRSIIGVPRIAS